MKETNNKIKDSMSRLTFDIEVKRGVEKESRVTQREAGKQGALAPQIERRKNVEDRRRN
jgi:hypothetical protein